MFDRPEQLLVIADADLPSVVAAANAREARLRAPDASRRAALWPAVDRGDPRLPRIIALAELLDLELLPRRSFAHAGQGSPSLLLLDAAHDAAAERRPDVLWPAKLPPGPHDAPNLDLVAHAIDRALLVTRLMALDAGLHGLPALHVEAPFVDLTDRQLADLAVDLAAPVHACWWWSASSVEALAARDRWMPALEAAGFTPPR